MGVQMNNGPLKAFFLTSRISRTGPKAPHVARSGFYPMMKTFSRGPWVFILAAFW